MKSQKVHCGHNSRQFLKKTIKKNMSKKILVLTGKASFHTSTGADFIRSALPWDLQTKIFNDFKVNPEINDLYKGIDVFGGFHPDLIIAIGGGSVIDMAKLINYFSATGMTPNEYLSGCQNAKPIIETSKMVAIPTTAGSGSEATSFAVLYADNLKYSVPHESILPDYAILDARFSMQLPGYQTACTGMDALSQAIEAFWSVRSTSASKKLAADAIQILNTNILEAVKYPNKTNRTAMLHGAHLAGQAINISNTTAPHAFSYDLASTYEIPHGHAVSLTLPFFIKFNAEVDHESLNDDRGLKYLRTTMSQLLGLFNCSTADGLSKYIQDLSGSIGLGWAPIKFNSENYIRVNQQRLANNPRKIEREEINSALQIWSDTTFRIFPN